jgi:hypothetical protein
MGRDQPDQGWADGLDKMLGATRSRRAASEYWRIVIGELSLEHLEGIYGHAYSHGVEENWLEESDSSGVHIEDVGAEEEEGASQSHDAQKILEEQRFRRRGIQRPWQPKGVDFYSVEGKHFMASKDGWLHKALLTDEALIETVASQPDKGCRLCEEARPYDVFQKGQRGLCRRCHARKNQKRDTEGLMDARNGMCISQCGLAAQVAYDLKAKHTHVVTTYRYPNELEHMCLVRFITRLTLIMLPGGQRGYDGSVMTFPNEFNHA